MGITNKDVLKTVAIDVPNMKSQLDNIEMEITNSTFEEKALFSFSDDDCMPTFVTLMKPILENNGVKCSLALPTSQVGINGTMTLSQLKALDEQGYEIISHGHSKILMNVTKDEMDIDLKMAKDKFNEYGFKNKNIIIYNGGNYNTDVGRLVKKVTRKYYKYAFNNFGSNNLVVDNFMIGRLDFNAKTLDELKVEVDNAIKYRAYLVFMVHSWQTTFDGTKLDNIIKYIQSKSMDIVPLSVGVVSKCNQVDVGEPNNYGGTRIDSNGRLTNNFLTLDSTTINRAIYDYPFGISYINLNEYVAGVTPQPSGLKDYSWSGYKSFITVVKRSLTECEQYLELDYLYKLKYIRKWDVNNNTWGVFKPCFSHINIDAIGNADILKSITNYDKNVVTEFRVAGGGNTPNSKAGIIKVHRMSDDTYSYMEFVQYDSATMYKNSWNAGTSTWNGWGKYS